jgi:pimeloyl-ACP methyl ester carboxylesterase
VHLTNEQFKLPLKTMKNAPARFLAMIRFLPLQPKSVIVWLCSFLFLGATASLSAEEFDSDGVKIHYVVEGRGEPVVLIHGLLASAAINWEWPGITAELAKDHQVIALDCRGHGLSGKPVEESQYGVQMVEDVVRLLDHLNIKKADIVGYSMGGMITMKLMVLHPERVRSAILGGMGWMADGHNLFPGIIEGSPRNAIEACILGFKDLAVSAQDVQGIKTPFIVIVGENDPLKNKFVEPLSKIRPDVPVKIVPEADHLSCVSKPEFKADIKAFLAASPRS